ncbi:pyridoxal phosphate-dependent transferase [Microdochium bolleyi]|uniref:Kynureninase n=1 Tax=Microdochium bolleyi TaxID=196109 RepID=A0A136J930_9PEZI|nr:pyridoxal phosphate-dependent transferase [Microdochium bolleyi]
MDVASSVQTLRSGKQAQFPASATTLEFAQSLDAQDAIAHLRSEYIIPTRRSMKKTALDGTIPGQPSSQINGTASTNGTSSSNDEDEIIYFVGNSLGAQPKAVREYVNAQLETWCSIGVNGHFRTLDNSPLTSWLTMAEDCSRKFAPIMGASPDEIVTMNSLTMNLHLMMASFYKPTATRHKIILEWKPFPSDHYAIESQVTWHGLDPKKSMVQLSPDNDNFYISTEQICAAIDEHADETALLLLPGIQYWSGQLFDIPRITAHAQSKGIVVGWDLAHAAGNVELSLHDWNVDFACWCTYKYMNAGPGAIAGAYIHERHGKVTFDSETGAPIFRPRLTGWYGGDLSVRFNMDNKFLPTPGASGYQCSNPSAIDMAALSGALSVFEKTSMRQLRDKALLITAYAEYLLDDMVATEKRDIPSFRIITPRDPRERGTQLSVLLREGLLDRVQANLEEAGIVCDKRKPDVIRVAPVPMYTRFVDVWRFMETLRKTLDEE